MSNCVISSRYDINNPNTPYCKPPLYGDAALSRSPRHPNGMSHLPSDKWTITSLTILACVYYIMAMLTYGVVASGGLFIPALFIGSLWGRVFGIVVIGVLPGVVSKFEIPTRT